MKNITQIRLIMAVALVGFIISCSSAVQIATSDPKTVNVDIKTFQYNPSPLQIPVGTTVMWTNQDAIQHSVTSGAPDKLDGKFDSGFFTQGQTFSYSFNEVGDFAYFCKRHPSMIGEVIVVPK